MLRTIFPEAAFISKQHQVKAPVQLQSKSLHSSIDTLLDSGTTDNFISPLIVNHFEIETFKLPRLKIVCNVDGSKNSIVPMTDAVNLNDQDYEFIPSNECNTITIGKVTTATELAI